ncbi:MAG: hypothetical protein GX949_06620 [Peptococcaceae bacterium]|jgi:hypothetical protein|nr:hypothetical protein [Peptococcaceae bacterium]
MDKKLLKMFLALCMVVTMLPVLVIAEETDLTIIENQEIITASAQLTCVSAFLRLSVNKRMTDPPKKPVFYFGQLTGFLC